LSRFNKETIEADTVSINEPKNTEEIVDNNIDENIEIKDEIKNNTNLEGQINLESA
jgi:hypothetical protein